MTTLKSHVNSSDLHRLNRSLEPLHVKAQVSLWGTRMIEVSGYQGSISLHDLACKVFSLTREDSTSERSTSFLKEANAKGEILTKLNKFYQDSDSEMQKANLLTRFFNSVREFFISPANARFLSIDQRSLG
jgi:hypothetical protein